jgi:ATP phosphoribosyltransferase
VAGRRKQITMERAIAILRECGWSVDVDDAGRKIVLQEPSPDVNWLHVLRQQDVAENEPRD